MTAYKNPNFPAIFVNPQYKDQTPFDRDLIHTLADAEKNKEAILNRGINFSDNFDCRSVTFTSSATPDAENNVAHALGKVPTGYIVYSRDKAGTVYDGTTAWTKTQIYLKCNVASVAVKILVF